MFRRCHVRLWLGAVVSDVPVPRPLRARKPTLRYLLSPLISRGTAIPSFPNSRTDRDPTGPRISLNHPQIAHIRKTVLFQCRHQLLQISNSTYLKIMMIYVNSWNCQSGGHPRVPCPMGQASDGSPSGTPGWPVAYVESSKPRPAPAGLSFQGQIRDVRQSLVFRSLIASRMSSSPSVAAGSMVLSVVGTCPPHDGVRGVASRCIPRSHADREPQRKRRDRQHRSVCLRPSTGRTVTPHPGRDDRSAPVRNTSAEHYGTIIDLFHRLLLGPPELGAIRPHAMKNDGELARHLGLLGADPLGRPEAPRLQR